MKTKIRKYLYLSIDNSFQGVGAPNLKVLILLKGHFAVYRKKVLNMHGSAMVYCQVNSRCCLNLWPCFIYHFGKDMSPLFCMAS